MKWGDRKRDADPILAVFPEYSPWFGRWWLLEYAESKPHRPVWRVRFVPAEQDHVRVDVYDDQNSAFAASYNLNEQLLEVLRSRSVDEYAKLP